MDTRILMGVLAVALLAVAGLALGQTDQPEEVPLKLPETTAHREELGDPPGRLEPRRELMTSAAVSWSRGLYTSVQVNVDACGHNLLGDAANEPSIAVDPTNPMRMAIGWRQFDTVASNFRQAGMAYTHDGGQTWHSPGVLDSGVFRSDPVLTSDAEGMFYYYSLTRESGEYWCDLFRSTDSGVSWSDPVYALGGDKGWMAVDTTGGTGHGNLYFKWSGYYGCCGENDFSRSVDGGNTFDEPVVAYDYPNYGTLAVGPDGTLYVAGASPYDDYRTRVARSTNAQYVGETPAFDFTLPVALGGPVRFDAGPNPDGMLGQVWVACDHSGSTTHGNLYVLSSIRPDGSTDPLDIRFSRSTDRGETWSNPVRVNDDPEDNEAWQWFGTMSVAPNGRIDVVWNDTRNDPTTTWSELYYTYSYDSGVTWALRRPASPPFNHFLGYPNQSKLGDYYDMVSDSDGAHLAWAATFNGEQDVYYVRLYPDCNDNGVQDAVDIAAGTSGDCNSNGIPDECDFAGAVDCDQNGLPDLCDPNGAEDCNTNGVPDFCDVRDGTSHDCDNDWIPDECGADCNQNGLADECDLAEGTSEDCDTNGVPDECQILGAPLHVIAEAVHCPLNDQYYVLTETAGSWAAGVAAAALYGGHLATINSAEQNAWLVDTFSRLTTVNSLYIGFTDQASERIWQWSSGDPVVYTNWAPNQPDNSCGCEHWAEVILATGLWNDHRDARYGLMEVQPTRDCNSNGVLDECDVRDGYSADCNTNNIPDECDPDCNANGVPDECDIAEATSVDCDSDGVPDECGDDCNTNGIADVCDLALGSSTDCNSNGYPDECELGGLSVALDFDGVNDRVIVPRADQLEPTDELTVEAWVRPDTVGEYHSRIVRIAGHFAPGYILAWQQSGDRRAQLRIDGAEQGAVRAADTESTSSYLGQWVHLAGVYSAAQDFCRLYVNGELRADVPSAGILQYSGADLTIGNFINSNEDFDGLIDEVRIWNVARSELEITRHMHLPLTGDELGLVGYWRFDEGAGQGAADSSPYENHGFLGIDASPAGDSDDPQWVPQGYSEGRTDCNTNGLLDQCEIDDGLAADCNANDLPDECEFAGAVDCNSNGVVDLCEPRGAEDCNTNGIPDWCDIRDTLSQDCNANEIPDECEADCNTNGIADECDIATSTSQDCNTNGIPDECELGAESDCNTNGVPDLCEPGGDKDCNANGVPDLCDIYLSSSTDTDLNRVPDECDPDCNTNGIVDGADLLSGTSTDCNSNGVPDECDVAGPGAWTNPVTGRRYSLTSYGSWPTARAEAVTIGGQLATIRNEAENQWVVDTFEPLLGEVGLYIGFNDISVEGEWGWSSGEPVTYTNWGPGEPSNGAEEDWGELLVRASGTLAAGAWRDTDAQRYGLIEFAALSEDCNSNSVPDECEIADGLATDCNGNAVLDECEPNEDCNTNGVQDICDIHDGTSADCNDDRIPDECQLWGGRDCDGNGVPDVCQPDCNDNGMADPCDILFGWREDCNTNGVPDDCEVATTDCNGNSVPDDCDLAAGTSFDYDSNGIPDECQEDCNGNGVLDSYEIAQGQAADCNTNEIPDECEVADANWAMDVSTRNWVTVSQFYEAADEFFLRRELTVEFWIRAATPEEAGECLLLRRTHDAWSPWELYWDYEGSGRIAFVVQGRVGEQVAVSDTINNDSYLDEWYHIAAAYSMSGDYCRLYVDGTLRSEVAAIGVLQNCTADLRFGRQGDGCSGLMDEVRVWDRARSQAEIQRDAERPLTGWEWGLVGYWRLNEGQQWSAADSSRFGRSGTMRYDRWAPSDAAPRHGDCDEDGVLDECELAAGQSADCQANGVPDECEWDDDCDENGIRDVCESAAGEMTDCNTNGMPDACELTWRDCNSNGIPDDCDLAAGIDIDCDQNGVPDECDVAMGDCNSNGVVDACDPDCNTNGIPDECDIAAGGSEDCDANGIPDECDIARLDCNGNGVPDACDVATGTSEDCTANGLPDECERDCDGNGVADICEIASSVHEDCNENLSPDWCDLEYGVSTDCDGNAVPDECDIASGLADDCNVNCHPDDCDAAECATDELWCQDCNENAVLDGCDLDSGASSDCNTNGLPDDCEGEDCNGNGVLDECDVSSGTSVDANASGIPDECEAVLRVRTGTTGTATGTNWAAAYPDLQEALTVADAAAGIVEEIWVAAGTYYPAPAGGDQSVSFELIDGVPVYGGFAGWETQRGQRDPAVNVTVLSGDLNANDVAAEFPAGASYDDNSDSVVTLSMAGATALLDGFVITGGCADGSQPFGGAVKITGAILLLSECTLTRNAAGMGGAAYVSEGELDVRRCVIRGNVGSDDGGGVFVYRSMFTLEDSLLTDNEAVDSGGAVRDLLGTATLRNCTITRNTAVNGTGGGLSCIASGLEVTNSVLWGNTDSIGSGEASQINASSATVDYSIVQGWTGSLGGVGNSGDDPALADPMGPDGVPGTEDDDLRPTFQSPCIDAGDPAFAPDPGAIDLDKRPRVLCSRVDIGAYEGGLGDFNCDRALDLTDFADWPTCFCGPDGGPYAAGCEIFDFDSDGDVDLADFAGFEPVFAAQ